MGTDADADTNTDIDANGDTVQTRFRRPGEMGAFAFALMLSCLATASQLIEAARGEHLSFGEIWGPVLIGLAQLLLLAVVVAAVRRASPGVLAASAVVLTALAWLSMIVWWVAAPAYLGIAAASLAGLLDRTASSPSGGTGRTAGIVGLFAAGANAILIVGALILTVVGS